MTAITETKAAADFRGLMSFVAESNDDVIITSDDGVNCVLISEENWRAISETAYLNSIPKMAESIIEAGKEKLEDCHLDSVHSRHSALL